MYGNQCDSLNTTRCNLAKSEKRQKVGKKLPPTKDRFSFHVLRTVYQLIIWRQADLTLMETPEPTDFGYEKDIQNKLIPTMMTQDISPPELPNDFLCKCPANECSDTSGCMCLKNAQLCTAACVCKASVLGTEEDTISCTNP